MIGIKGWQLRPLGQLANLVALVVGVATAYFMTIQSLKIELADKAESKVVETLDKKLSAFEVFLKEGVIGKEQFYEFSRVTEARLIRIEQYLLKQTGERIGQK